MHDAAATALLLLGLAAEHVGMRELRNTVHMGMRWSRNTGTPVAYQTHLEQGARGKGGHRLRSILGLALPKRQTCVCYFLLQRTCIDPSSCSAMQVGGFEHSQHTRRDEGACLEPVALTPLTSHLRSLVEATCVCTSTYDHHTQYVHAVCLIQSCLIQQVEPSLRPVDNTVKGAP
jgi:hypothetical protein